MSAELETLIGFLDHGNTQVRQVAITPLTWQATSNLPLLKKNQQKPINDLKLLVRDYPPISQSALDILINVSTDPEILDNLSGDDVFLETLVQRIVKPDTPHVDLHCMLLANLAKSSKLQRLRTLKRPIAKNVSSSVYALDQLFDCFVHTGDVQDVERYDHLSYVFADLSKYDVIRTYLTTTQKYDGIIPISKIKIFTEHASKVRRRGVASTIKNASFPPTDPLQLLGESGCEVLPYLLLPLASGQDHYSSEETMELPDDLQLLSSSKRREADPEILQMHLETILLLTSTKPAREFLREKGTYYVVRECHAAIDDETVQEACDRIVQMLMRDEPAEEADETQRTDSEGDEEEKIIDIF